MPISGMRFDNGLFFAREVGDICAEDAREWAEQLRRAATASATPVVALVDALDVGFVEGGARAVFAEATRIPNVRVTAVAVSSVLGVEAARQVMLRGEPGKTFIFVTLTEARTFAQRILAGGEISPR